MSDFHVGLLSDSFPPVIDGVAQTVKNYATNLSFQNCKVSVVAPQYKEAVDNYPFEVLRYPSISMGSLLGYRVGVPFDPETLIRLRNRKFDLLHVHAPFASSVLANNIRGRHTPVVLTYHTKFDLDIEKRVPTSAMRKIALEFLLHNINAADEVWAVTSGCIEALRKVGYEGPCRVMENGTDFARGRASESQIAALRETYHLYEDVPVFLFVGRLMWYKNVRIILDALKILKDNGLPFRALIVGDGYDAPEMKTYTQECGLADQVIFTGTIHDREYLRVFYSVSDMFLFPSTYDTSGIVVKEAAACDCPSLLVRDSCASEGVIHTVSGYLAEENAASCAEVIMKACEDRASIKQVGIRAGQDLYLSWEEAVSRAYARYREILSKA